MQNPLYVVGMFSVIAYVISAMFGNSMYYTSPYFMILLGLLIGKKKQTNKIVSLLFYSSNISGG